MKAGMTLKELAVTVTEQLPQKRDFVTPTDFMQVQSNGHVELHLPGFGEYEVGPVATRQLGEYLGVPARFWDTLNAQRETLRDPYAPERPLFDTVTNSMLAAKTGGKRMIRTLSPVVAGTDMPMARAILSERYRPIDNYEILERMLPVLANTPGVDLNNTELNSVQVTDSRLYLKVTNTRAQVEVKKGDVIQAGVMITNSEVGLGSFAVQPFYVRLICLNGATATDFVKRKFHAGANWGRLLTGDENAPVAEYITDETVRALNAATILEMRDQVQAALGEAMLGDIAGKLREATEIKLEGSPVAAVQEVRDRFALTAGEGEGVLRALIEGADLSLYGLSNAVNRYAQDVDSYDRSTELEVVAGKLIALPKPDLKAIVTATEARTK